MTDAESSGAIGLIKSLAYSVPTDGVIRTGYTTTNANGQRLPVKDDEFRLTLKFKDRSTGDWVPHPLDAKLRETHGEPVDVPNGPVVRKLRRIPVKIAFDRPELNMAEQYAAFTNQGVPLCVGDGCKAKRRQPDGSVTEEVCVGARFCKYGEANRCDAFLRLLVRVEGQDDTAPPMILRTGSINAVTDNRTTLEYWHAMFGGRLAGLPFTFVLDAKQSALSRHSVFYYGRLEPRFKTAIEGAQLLKSLRKEEAELGIDRTAAEDALIALRKNGAFAENGEDGEQFEDLLVGRFTTEVGDEKREIRIPGAAVGLQVPPAQAAATAVMQLHSLYATARPAATPLQPAEAADAPTVAG
jgi:hypothetical protein